MHHQSHTFGMGIIVERLDVKISIGCLEVEYIVLFMTKPIFPSNVPTLDKHLCESVLCRKVDIFSHIFVVRRVIAMGLAFGIVGGADMHRGQVVGI